MDARQNLLVLTSVIGAILFSLATEARATLIIVLRDDTTVIIGADSQLSNSQKMPSGNSCKIRFTNNYVWMTAGLYRDGPFFDVWAEAQSAISAGGSLEDIVSRFERAVTNGLQEYLTGMKATQPDLYAALVARSSNVVSSIFLERTNVVTSSFSLPDANTPQNIKVARHSCPGICPAERIYRFVIGNFDAAEAELARFPTLWDTKGFVEGIKYLMEVQHQATPTDVAAPVSILRVNKDGTKQWLQNGLCN